MLYREIKVADCANLEEHINNYTEYKKAIFEFSRLWYINLPLEVSFLLLNQMSTFKILSTQIYYSPVTFCMFYVEKKWSYSLALVRKVLFGLSKDT